MNRIHNEAANRYQRAVGVVEKYQKKLPNGKYAKNAFISGFYTHFAYATQAHAIDLAAKEEENPSYENHELLIKRLQQSKQGFEKNHSRSVNDEYYYACTLQMLAQYDDPSYFTSFFRALAEVEKNADHLDKGIISDLYLKIGEAYEFVYGVKKNEKKAVQYIKRAGKAGRICACHAGKYVCRLGEYELSSDNV